MFVLLLIGLLGWVLVCFAIMFWLDLFLLCCFGFCYCFGFVGCLQRSCICEFAFLGLGFAILFVCDLIVGWIWAYGC